jgi:hypothetical protein
MKFPSSIKGKLKNIQIFKMRAVLNFCAANRRYPSKSYILYLNTYSSKKIRTGNSNPEMNPI